MKYRRADHIAWRRIDDEMVLVDLAAKDMLGFNLSGGEVWQTFEQPRDSHELALAVAEGSPEVTASDIESFVDQLIELGLLIAVPGPQAIPGPQEIADDTAGSQQLAAAPRISEKPSLLWQEEVKQAAGTCAFLPGSGPLCNQAPFS